MTNIKETFRSRFHFRLVWMILKQYIISVNKAEVLLI